MKRKGIVIGKLRTHGEWDAITINLDNGDLIYLGNNLNAYGRDTVISLMEVWVDEGRLILPDIMSPTKYIKKFNSGMTI